MIPFFTVTGRRLDLGKPQASDVAIVDLACALSKICRYNGQVEAFYSVAQHECLVAELVDPYLAFPAIHHDDSEAYLGDVSSKLKHSPLFRSFVVLEDAWTAVIEDALGISLSPEERAHIKTADDLAAIYERVVLRFRRRFELDDISRAVDEEWVTKSSVGDMIKMAQRLPASFTPLSSEIAKVVWITSQARYGVRWRDGVRA